MKALIDGWSIDREIAEEERCPECDSSMSFEPRIIDGEYHAFAVCNNPDCDEEIDF